MGPEQTNNFLLNETAPSSYLKAQRYGYWGTLVSAFVYELCIIYQAEIHIQISISSIVYYVQ